MLPDKIVRTAPTPIHDMFILTFTSQLSSPVCQMQVVVHSRATESTQNKYIHWDKDDF